MRPEEKPDPQRGPAASGHYRRNALCFADRSSLTVTLTAEAAGLLGLAPAESSPVLTTKLPGKLQALVEECAKSQTSLPAQEVIFERSSGESTTLMVEAFYTAGPIVLALQAPADGAITEALARLERLAGIGTLSAMMAHEVKNALVASKTFVELLLEKQPGSELAEVVRRELSRIDEISSGVLRYARPRDGERESFRLHTCLEYLLRLLHPRIRSHGIEVETVFEADPDLLHGSEPALQQACLNLMLNAIEAMTSGGKLILKTDLQRASKPEEAQWLRLTIQDTGPGVRPEDAVQMFQPFFTTKPDGTGLGLAIAHRIIRDHNGMIRLENPSERGARFAILLPTG